MRNLKQALKNPEMTTKHRETQKTMCINA